MSEPHSASSTSHCRSGPPPGSYERRRRRQRPRRPAGLLLPLAPGHRPRRHLRRPRPRRHVPALPVLPAPPVLDQAACPAGARLARVRTLRLEQPGGLRAGAPRHHGLAHGRLLRVPVAGRDGRGHPALRRAHRPARALRDDLAGHQPRRRRLRPAHLRRSSIAARVVIFAVGIAEPLLPETPGIEHAAHYVQTRDAASYAGKRLFIIGKQNSGFELASGLLQWASPIILASPRPAQLSVNLHSLGGVRARYIQPWEDAALGGGVFILDAAIERIERRSSGLAGAHPAHGHLGALRGRGGRGHRRDRLPRAPPGPPGRRRQRSSAAAGCRP